MLRRVVSHPLFYIVLLGGLLALILSARNVSWQTWLGVWTSKKQVAPMVYQQKSHVDNSVIGVTMLHLELINSTTASSVSFGQAVDVLHKSDAILANNVVSYLQNANNKRLALDTYTKNIDKTLSEASSALTSLETERDNASQEYSACAADKTAADNQFFQGLRVIDAGLMQQGYNDSLKAGACEATNRITTNAYQAIITRMTAYTSALSQLNILLTDNEDLIVANVDLFRDSYLEKLIQIRDQLGVMTKSSALD